MPPSNRRHVNESSTPVAPVDDAQKNAPAPSDPTEAVGEKHVAEPDVDISDLDADKKASREDIRRPVQGGDVTPAATARTGRPTNQQLAGEKAVRDARKEKAAEDRKAEDATARTGGRATDNRVVPPHPTGGRVSGDRR